MPDIALTQIRKCLSVAFPLRHRLFAGECCHNEKAGPGARRNRLQDRALSASVFAAPNQNKRSSLSVEGCSRVFDSADCAVLMKLPLTRTRCPPSVRK